MPEDTDRRPVVIVGAGPTGLTAALELSRLGVDVRIVDRGAAPSINSKALAIQGRTLELLMDRGVGHELLRLGNRATGAVMHSGGKQVGGVDVSRAPGRHNYILLLPQSETERVLTSAAESNGVKVEFGVAATALTTSADAVSLTLTSADGSEETIEAAYVIGADGSNSTVRTLAGIPFDGRSLPQSYLLADVRIDGDLRQDALSVYTGADGFMAVFPLGDNRYRLMVKDDGPSSDTPSMATLNARFARVCPIPVQFRELLWGSRFRIQSRHVPTVRAGRVLLGGDAAHVHSPAGGQGMNSGIQDMINLCWKLAMVINGQARPELLDTYDSERMPVIRNLIAMTEKMTSFTNSTSPATQLALRLLGPLALGRNAVQNKAAARLSQVSISYRDAPSARRAGGVAGLSAGDRVPDWSVIVGSEQRRLYEVLDTAVPTLVVVGDVPDDVVTTYLRWADRVALRELTLPAEQPDLRGSDAKTAQRLGSESAWLLVRPDGYLATAGYPGMTSQLAEWFETWLGTPLES